MTGAQIHGVLVVDKPAGPTSHDIVDRVRRVFGERRVGHTGTLDPFATGVLVVCIGKATRLVRFLAEGEKVYEATIRLGFATTTDDLTGEALGPPVEVDVARPAIEAAARALTGTLDQVAPAFSAKRQGGKRLYEVARAGASVEPRTSRVHVASLEVRAVRGSEVDVVVRCSPGTYIRALARDMGAALGVGGHLTALRRVASSGFTLDEAVPADALEPSAIERLKPLASLLPGWPTVILSPREAEQVRHGRPVETGAPPPVDVSATPERVRLVDESNDLVGLGLREQNAGGQVLRADIVLG